MPYISGATVFPQATTFALAVYRNTYLLWILTSKHGRAELFAFPMNFLEISVFAKIRGKSLGLSWYEFWDMDCEEVGEEWVCSAQKVIKEIMQKKKSHKN